MPLWILKPSDLVLDSDQKLQNYFINQITEIRTFIYLWLSCCWVSKSCPILCSPMQHARLLCPPLSPGICSKLCSLGWWFCSTISSSVAPFSSCLQSFPATGSFPMSQPFTSGGQRPEVSASASVLPMNIQDSFPLGWTGWISLQSKGLLRVFSSATAGKHQFFGAQPSLWSNSHICTWLLEKP